MPTSCLGAMTHNMLLSNMKNSLALLLLEYFQVSVRTSFPWMTEITRKLIKYFNKIVLNQTLYPPPPTPQLNHRFCDSWLQRACFVIPMLVSVWCKISYICTSLWTISSLVMRCVVRFRSCIRVLRLCDHSLRISLDSLCELKVTMPAGRSIRAKTVLDTTSSERNDSVSWNSTKKKLSKLEGKIVTFNVIFYRAPFLLEEIKKLSLTDISHSCPRYTCIEQFWIECRKTITKVITLRKDTETHCLIKTRSNYTKSGKTCASKSGLVWVLLLIGWESGASFLSQSLSVVMQNQSKRKLLSTLKWKSL